MVPKIREYRLPGDRAADILHHHANQWLVSEGGKYGGSAEWKPNRNKSFTLTLSQTMPKGRNKNPMPNYRQLLQGLKAAHEEHKGAPSAMFRIQVSQPRERTVQITVEPHPDALKEIFKRATKSRPVSPMPI